MPKCSDPVILNHWHPLAAIDETPGGKVVETVLLEEPMSFAVDGAGGAAVWRSRPDLPAGTPLAMEMALGRSHRERRAHGTFEVKVAPQSPDNPPAQGAGLARLSLDKRYSGSLEATGQGEMLADGGGNRKDGAYVALERVTGTLDGRAGSFALVHRALMRDGTPEGWSVVVVPGSGTGALAGLEGSLRITIEHGTHFYDLEYTLPG